MDLNEIPMDFEGKKHLESDFNFRSKSFSSQAGAEFRKLSKGNAFFLIKNKLNISLKSGGRKCDRRS